MRKTVCLACLHYPPYRACKRHLAAMFKKERDLAERSKTQLKKSEVKALIAQVRTQLGADVTDLIGGSKAVVFATKLASRTVIYSSGMRVTLQHSSLRTDSAHSF